MRAPNSIVGLESSAWELVGNIRCPMKSHDQYPSLVPVKQAIECVKYGTVSHKASASYFLWLNHIYLSRQSVTPHTRPKITIVTSPGQQRSDTRPTYFNFRHLSVSVFKTFWTHSQTSVELEVKNHTQLKLKLVWNWLYDFNNSGSLLLEPYTGSVRFRISSVGNVDQLVFVWASTKLHAYFSFVRFLLWDRVFYITRSSSPHLFVFWLRYSVFLTLWPILDHMDQQLLPG